MNLLQSAHAFWETVARPGDRVIDATVGNGRDLLKLIEMLKGQGTFIGYDIQLEAIEKTRALVGGAATLHHRSHCDFLEPSAKLIVYNLGYLPGGDKTLTTRVATTLQSVETACQILEPNGAVSLMCYPGHPEGAKEERALLAFAATLSSQKWACSHLRLVNRQLAPSLLLIQSIM